MIKLYQNSNFKGYSLSIDGEVDKDDALIVFNSLEVHPNTEMIIYNRNNDLLTVHNGSLNKIARIKDLSDYVKIDSTGLSVKINKIKTDGTIFAKNSINGNTLTVPTKNISGQELIIKIIMIILAIYGLYSLYHTYIDKQIKTIGNLVESR